jgi:hypothetical protein
MTLIAAFRSTKSGVLLCSDREEDDGVSKRSVDKIHRIRQFSPCEFFLAATGITPIIKDSQIEIHQSLAGYVAGGGNAEFFWRLKTRFFGSIVFRVVIAQD